MNHCPAVIVIIFHSMEQTKVFHCFQRRDLVMVWVMMGLTRCWCWWWWWWEVWKYFWLIFSQSAVVTPVWVLTKCRDRVYWWNIQYIDCNISGRYLLPQHFILKTGKNRTWYSCRQTNIYDLLSDFVIGNLFQYCPRVLPTYMHHLSHFQSKLKYSKFDI